MALKKTLGGIFEHFMQWATCIFLFHPAATHIDKWGNCDSGSSLVVTYPAAGRGVAQARPALESWHSHPSGVCKRFAV